MENRNASPKVIAVIVGLLSLSLVGTGCARGFETPATGSLASHDGASEIDPADPISSAPIASEPPDFDLGICSRLDFSKIVWPTKLPVGERKAMALALNITGSYEGGAGWANLANNFDGQGMSLGLNQQNLGQNTLQPLLITFLKNNPATAKKLFTTTALNSLTRMLTTWKGSSISSLKVTSDEELFSDAAALSNLDEGSETSMFKVFDARSDASVAWAKANIFQSNGAFKTEWRKSFTDLAVTPPYRSAQLEEALSLFTKAKGYFSSLGFTELRSLLVMYDFVVQNGGFNKDHLAQFQQFDRSKPNATESERLLKLLEIRLVSVKAQYRNDVKARKSTIINGVGRVHGVNRDLEKEYCSRLRVPVAGTPIPGPM